MTHKHLCRNCGDEIATKRWALGYKFCLACGDEYAKQKKFCVVPMHKSNYVLITDKDLLTGVNTQVIDFIECSNFVPFVPQCSAVMEQEKHI